MSPSTLHRRSPSLVIFVSLPYVAIVFSSARLRLRWMAQFKGSPPWSDLPPELLGLVFLRLPKRADRAFFHAVCRAWCAAVRQCRLPLPSPVPWLVLSDGSATSFPHGEIFHLPNSVRCHSSCGEWLLLSRHDGSCFLMNHITKATMPLPSLSSYSYYQEHVEVDEVINFGRTWMDNKDTGKISMLSLVVCSTRLIAAILAVGDYGTIALCRPGAAAWSVSAHEQCMVLSHMVSFQGKLYALNMATGAAEDLIAINIVDANDSDEPRVSRIEHLIQGDYLPPQIHCCYRRYLVESHGTLLMIRRTHSFTREDGILVAESNECEVFEADFEQGLWDEVSTLGNDQTLFLGQGNSRAVRVSPYDLSRDCIFFLDDCHCHNCPIEKTTESCRVYDMKDEKVYSTLPMLSWKSGKVRATWIFSQGETDKLQTEREGLQKIVEPDEVDPLTRLCGPTCSG